MRIESQSTTKSKSMNLQRNFYLSFLLGILLSTIAVAYFIDGLRLATFVFGEVFLSLEFFLMAMQLKALRSKKSVAWSVFIIVIKYPLFIGILYFLSEKIGLPMIYFFFGMANLVVIAVIYLLMNKFLAGKPELRKTFKDL